jgi:formylglycine-generating enzyme required for sulfatase activity
MLESLLALSTFAGALLSVPLAPPLDPGPSEECPSDMRLVRGTHYDVMEHYCVNPDEDKKDTHCYSYWPGLSAEEGPVKEINVCMDMYEAPNQRGQKPYVMKSYKMGKSWCEKRGRRMCAEEEWETACEGPEKRPLAYGWAVDKKLCNSDKQWQQFDAKKLNDPDDDVSKEEVERLWQGSTSGKYLTCVSAFGIFDMMGNVEEWVSTRSSRKWPGALMGGFWAKPWTGCRGTNDAHEPTFVFYETGFRCCAEPGTLDAKGKPIKKAQAGGGKGSGARAK